MDTTRTVSAFVLLVLSLTLAVCASPPLAPPEGAPVVRGTVAWVRHSATASGALIEAEGGACGMQATLDAGTRVLRRTRRGALSWVGEGAAGAGALAVGDAVEIWADGPVIETCPMEGRASVVVIGRRPRGAAQATPSTADATAARLPTPSLPSTFSVWRRAVAGAM